MAWTVPAGGADHHERKPQRHDEAETESDHRLGGRRCDRAGPAVFQISFHLMKPSRRWWFLVTGPVYLHQPGTAHNRPRAT